MWMYGSLLAEASLGHVCFQVPTLEDLFLAASHASMTVIFRGLRIKIAQRKAHVSNLFWDKGQ